MTNPGLRRSRCRRPLGAVCAVAILSGLMSGIMLTAPGCAPKAESLLLSAPWKPGELSRLEVRSATSGAPVADWLIAVRATADGRGWVLQNTVTAPQGEESSAVELDGTTLAPLRVDFTAKGQVEASYTALYGKGRCTVEATVGGKKQSGQVRLPSGPYFDNEQVVATLRAFPLAEGWKTTVAIIASRSVQKVQVEVKVSGTEEVSVPAGTYRCWVVEFPQLRQKAWVAVEPPHQLVRYVNEAALTESVLVEYSEGSQP